MTFSSANGFALSALYEKLKISVKKKNGDEGSRPNMGEVYQNRLRQKTVEAGPETHKDGCVENEKKDLGITWEKLIRSAQDKKR